MKIKIVYFIFLVPNRWELIVGEQLSSLKKLDLFNISDEIVIACVGNKDEFNKLSNFISKEYPKIVIKEYSEENHFEYLGFKTLYEIADDDSIILYFHTKGVVSGQENNTNNNLRKLLFKLTIENYEIYLNNFKSDSNLMTSSLYPGLNGTTWYNFFWVRGDFIKKNMTKPQKSTNRFFWEHWFKNYKLEIKSFSPILGQDKIKNKKEIYKNNENLFLKYEI